MEPIELMEKLIAAGFEVWCGPSRRPTNNPAHPQYFVETRNAVKDEGPEKTIWADTLQEALTKLAVYHGLISTHHGNIACICKSQDGFHSGECWQQ